MGTRRNGRETVAQLLQAAWMHLRCIMEPRSTSLRSAGGLQFFFGDWGGATVWKSARLPKKSPATA